MNDNVEPNKSQDLGTENSLEKALKANIQDKHVLDIIKMMNSDLIIDRMDKHDDSLNELESQNESRIEHSPNLDENFYSDEKCSQSESNTEETSDKNVEPNNEHPPTDSGCDSEMDNYKKFEPLTKEKTVLNEPNNMNYYYSDENEEDDHDGNEDDPEIVDFIKKAIEFQANAVDLSKKNLKKIPKQLYELSNLQVE